MMPHDSLTLRQVLERTINRVDEQVAELGDYDEKIKKVMRSNIIIGNVIIYMIKRGDFNQAYKKRIE